ncbi:MAG: peptidase M24 family protein [Dethiosulfovibrio peptidovorans]|nr:MAG: peptidase M24 family protein [Dethiosulfovibrio peptidovorans]
MNEQRTNKILDHMKQKGVSSILVSDPSSVFYLTGKWMHTGERLLVLYLNSKGEHKLVNNELFPLHDDLGLDIVWYDDTQDPVEKIALLVGEKDTIGIDKVWPSRFLLRLQELKSAATYVNGSSVVDAVRMRKDEAERARMRKASVLNDQSMGMMIPMVGTGQFSEKEMGQKLATIYEDLGTEGFSFNPIIGYGKNCADPHHEIDGSMVSEGDSVIIDIGCVKDSYCSDMTRTVFYKKVSQKAKDVYALVREANQKGIDTVKPGVRFCDVDNAAREHISTAGFGQYFTHRTGHSIGIDVHEHGDVSAANTDVLEEGMIFSVEPGIYIPGEFGVRIEDLVLVTDSGCEVLNSYDKSLTIIGD